MSLDRLWPFLAAALLGLVVLLAWRLGRSQARLQQLEDAVSRLRELDFRGLATLPSALEHLRQSQQQLPQQVLRCIQGNLNTLKGQTAELIAYLQLSAAYDRLLPFNSITDFIGIRFPRDDFPGSLDFIDIKTGNARLSPEQRKLQKIIEEKHVRFVKVKISTDSPRAGVQGEEESECEST